MHRAPFIHKHRKWLLVMGSAIEVHKDKGPGLLESIYEWCLVMELQLRGYQVKNQDVVAGC